MNYLNYPSIRSEDLIFDVLKRKEIKRMTIGPFVNECMYLKGCGWKLTEGNIEVGYNFNGHMFL